MLQFDFDRSESEISDSLIYHANRERRPHQLQRVRGVVCAAQTRSCDPIPFPTLSCSALSKCSVFT